MPQTLTEKAQVLGAIAMVAVALGVVSFLAVQGNETAAGALIGVVTSGTGFYLRGKVEK